MRSFTDGVEMDILFFDGTKEDLLEAKEYIVDELGYDIYEIFEDETADDGFKYKLRDKDRNDVTTLDDIKDGMVILFTTPLEGDPVAIGYGMNRQEFLTCTVSAFGVMYEADEGTLFSVSLVNLFDDNNRSYYESFKADFKADYKQGYENFKDVMLVETDQDDFYSFIVNEFRKPDVKDLVLFNTNTKDEIKCTPETITSKEAIVPGMVLIGNAQREDDTPQMGFLGYNVDDEKLSVFVVELLESFGFVNVFEHVPDIIHVKFEDGLLGSGNF